ncbi:MAG: hypothetical protein WCI78_17355 [Mycobacterium sp.]
MTKVSIAGLLLVAALTASPTAVADPEDLEPYCTGGQMPDTGECLLQPQSVYIDDATGANPQVPTGLDPGSVPAV